MLKKIFGLSLGLVFAANAAAFAGSAGDSVNTSTTSSSTSTSTTTSSSTSSQSTNVGNIWLGYQVTGTSTNTAHHGYADGSLTYSYSGNYNSQLELLVQGAPSSWSESGSYWAATHPAQYFVSQGGRGAVNYEGSLQFMGTSNTALSATQVTQQVTQQTSQQTTQDTTVTNITIGDFVLGTNTNVNTNVNTNTNTNTNTDYNYLSGTGTFDYYEVNSSHWVSPLVLDLSHTGKLDASGGKHLPHQGLLSKKVVLFDIAGTGSDMLVEWLGPKMGLLCEPKADGTVDGSCLFGDQTGFDNGFQKLSMRDKDGNKVVRGSELNGLMVWVDENQDGKAQKNELKSLADLKISELDVRERNMVGSFTMNGQKETMWDWYPTALDVRRRTSLAKK